MLLQSKLPNIGTSIFTTMSKMAADHQAINLSQGFPNFDCNPKIIDLMQKHMREGHNQYAPMAGLMLLRERLAQKYVNLYHSTYNPDTEITITTGATQAFYTCMSAFVGFGHEVILFDPCYDSYEPSVLVHGGIAKFVHLSPHNDFAYDWAAAQNLISAKTKAIVVNSPNNPTGSVLTQSDVETLIKIIEKNPHILVISDEVYEHIVFDENKHISLSHFDELKDNLLVISSFGKTYHTTGWKVGYLLANEKLTNEFRKVHQFTVFSVNTPAQFAFADLLEDEAMYLELPDFYAQKRHYFSQQLKNSKFGLKACKSTYFQLVDYSSINNNLDDLAFTHWLIRDVGVAAIPLSAFYHTKTDYKMLRLCFAKTEQTLHDAAQKLIKI